MEADSLIVTIKTGNVYKNIENDVEKRFDASKYETERLLLTGKNNNVVGLMKDELDGKVMTEFVGPKLKICSYLIDDSSGDKKLKEQRSE